MAARSQQSPGRRGPHVRHTPGGSTLGGCPCLGDPRGSLGAVPLGLTEKTQESGQTSPSTDSQSLSGLAEGRSWGRAQWNGKGTGTDYGSGTPNPAPSCRGGLPSAPWQTSVRVAPSTINWGFDSSSYKTRRLVWGPAPTWSPMPTPRHCFLPRDLQPPLVPHPPHPRTECGGVLAHRGALPFDAIGL